MKKTILLLSAVFVLAGCHSKKGDQQNETENTTRKLILYYSQTGVTDKVAHILAENLNADLLRFDVEEPYDGSFEGTIERCKMEMEENYLSKLAALDLDLSKYDTIFLGYPIWFGTYARPIASLLKEIDFTGKVIVPFCTFGSGGIESSSQHLKEALPSSTILSGYGVREARINKCEVEIKRFLIENNFVEGTVEPLPSFGEEKSVSKTDVDIFNAACGDYKFPLGTPIMVAKRPTKTGFDYRFISEVGGGAVFTVYVTVENKTDATPEFTRVVR